LSHPIVHRQRARVIVVRVNARKAPSLNRVPPRDWVAGPGATPDAAAATGARLLDLDPLAAAEHVAVARTA
jgi:hypothetical protein